MKFIYTFDIFHVCRFHKLEKNDYQSDFLKLERMLKDNYLFSNLRHAY